MKATYLGAVITTALLLQPLPAQDKASEPEMLPAAIRISILAIGDPPQPRFSIVGDKRVLIDTPASDYPPGTLFLSEKSGKSEDFKEVTLGLNTPTGYVTYKGETKLKFYRSAGDGEREPYATFPVPKLKADMTIMLTRARKTGSWESNPSATFLDNSFAAFPPDCARVVNLSAVPVRIVTNFSKLFELAPGKIRLIPLSRSTQGTLAYQAAAFADGKTFPFADTATTYSENNRINLVAYNADGEDKRQPVKIIRYFERPPEPPKKKEKTGKN